MSNPPPLNTLELFRQISEERRECDRKHEKLHASYQESLAKRWRGLKWISATLCSLVIATGALTLGCVWFEISWGWIKSETMSQLESKYKQIIESANESLVRNKKVAEELTENLEYRFLAGSIPSAKKPGKGRGYAYKFDTKGLSREKDRIQYTVTFSPPLPSRPIMLLSNGDATNKQGADYDNASNFRNVSKKGFSVVSWDISSESGNKGDSNTINFLAVYKTPGSNGGK